jgi:thiamine-monophosphate kinase
VASEKSAAHENRSTSAGGEAQRPGSGEDAAVARIAARFARASGGPPSGEVWIGDDAAVVGVCGTRLVLATDAAVGGVHADLSLVSLSDLGWKALAATLSDVAAVGGRPSHVLVTFCVPPGTDLDLLADGVAEAAERWDCTVVGGDVTASSQVMVSAFATGVLDGPAPPVLRSGAKAGDRLFVTGPLGAAAAGLRVLRARRAGLRTSQMDRRSGPPDDARDLALVVAHRRPVARVDEGIAARSAGAIAMIDISDGLSIDLHRLADASEVGFALERVPVAPGATEEEALAGGEDYELVVATPDPGALRAAFAAAGLRTPVEIGRCDADPSVRELHGAPLARAGYEHALG